MAILSCNCECEATQTVELNHVVILFIDFVYLSKWIRCSAKIVPRAPMDSCQLKVGSARASHFLDPSLSMSINVP